MAASSISLSLLLPSQKPLYSLHLYKPSHHFHSPTTNLTPFSLQINSPKSFQISATSTDVLPPAPVDTPIETTQGIIASEAAGGVSNIVSSLLFVAFLGLSILTIGVVYIAVTDFLQKREKDKFEKEEAAKKSRKRGKKRVVRSRTGPKGFGQKIDEDDYDD